MWLFFLLILFRASFGYFQSHYGVEVVFDLVAVYLIWPLLKKVEIRKAIEAWRYLRYRKNTRKKIQFVSAIVLDILRLMAIFYLTSWLVRWARFDWKAGGSSVTPRDLSFIDTFFLCFFLSQFATAHRWSWWISKIPLNHGRQVVLHYLAAILIGSLLLLSPFSIKLGASLSVIDAFFLSVSALSVTGLSPVDISQVLTQWGQFILLSLIQLGGLGIVMVTAALSYAANSRLSLSSMQLGQTTFGTHHPGEIPKFLSQVLYATLFFETLGALLLYYSLPEELPNRIFCAIFHSISAFCNAGFSIFPNNLHASPFFGGGIVVICFLIVIGGIGFPVLFDLQKMLLQKKISYERLSPHSQLSLLATFLLLVGGAGLFFLFEITHLSSGLDFLSGLGHSIFYSITARTAGFNMLPVERFHASAQLFLLLLMLIGANPASTGGGIKTTTVGVLFATVYSTLTNKNQTIVFRRQIPFQVVKKSLSIVIIYLLIAGLAITVLTITEERTSFELSFEVISALSTVGLSLGITSKLSVLGKLIIMFLMLFGRVGILTIVLAGIGQAKPSRIRYPEDDFYVG